MNFFYKECPRISNITVKIFIKLIKPLICLVYWWTILSLLFYWSRVHEKNYTEKKLNFWRYFCVIYIGIIILLFFLFLKISLLQILSITNYFL